MKMTYPKMKKVFLLLAAFLGVIFFCLYHDNKVFAYDASAYWSLGRAFWGNGFSLNNYPETIRGYSLPLVLGFAAKVGEVIFGNEYIVYWILYSSLTVVLTMILLPKLIGAELWTKRYFVCGVGTLLLFLYFWDFLLIYPLSDLPALVLYITILLSLKSLALCEGRKLKDKVLVAFMVGLVSYIAYNVRTVYLYPIALAWVMYVGYCVCMRRKELPLLLIAATAGMIPAAIPQILINLNHYGRFSAAVYTSYAGESNLFIAQLVAGIRVPRYETFIGDASVYPQPSVYFVNKLGNYLYQEQQIHTIGAYINWLLNHIIEAIAIYTEHLISGITIFWRQGYLTTLKVDTVAFFLNCGLFILAGFGLLSSKNKWHANVRFEIIVPILFAVLPSLMAMFGALEVRFFLCVHLLVYTYVFLKLDYKKLGQYIKNNYVEVTLVAIVILFVWCMSASHLLSEIEHGMWLLSGK